MNKKRIKCVTLREQAEAVESEVIAQEQRIKITYKPSSIMHRHLAALRAAHKTLIEIQR